MNHVCNFCNKAFSSQYTLSIHQKTAKYCIALQPVGNPSKNFVCEHCNKSFTTKTNLNTHILSCKIKQEHDKLKQQNSIVEQEKSKILQEKEQEIKLLMKDTQIQYEKELDLLRQELRLVKEQLADKTLEVSSLLDKLTSFQSQHVTIHDNSTNNNYNVQFNKMVEQLLPFTDENVCKQFGKIPTNAIRSDINKMEETFMSHFGKIMSPLVFCTDASRGRLVIKDEDGHPVKRLAEHFVLDCLIKCKKGVNILIRDIGYQLDQDFEEGNLDSIEHREFTLQHAYLHDYLKTHKETITPYIKKLSSFLSRTCPQLQK